MYDARRPGYNFVKRFSVGAKHTWTWREGHLLRDVGVWLSREHYSARSLSTSMLSRTWEKKQG